MDLHCLNGFVLVECERNANLIGVQAQDFYMNLYIANKNKSINIFFLIKMLNRLKFSYQLESEAVRLVWWVQTMKPLTRCSRSAT